ncbi:MAG: helical backbone metal receptor [Myxococcota bacterium]
MILIRPPRRIVSLVPSDTETLFAMGAGDRVVGRTRYCEEPADRIADIPICGGTKDIDVAAVGELSPDLILCNREENSRPPLETLAQSGHQVYVSFPCRVIDGIAHLARLARMLGVAAQPEVRQLVRRGHQLLAEAERERAQRDGQTAPAVFVPIWNNPLMTMNEHTFGSDMLSLAGGHNAFADRQRRYPLAADLGLRAPVPAADVGGRDTRYPRVTADEVRSRAPDMVLLPDEPHAFTAADAARFRDEVLGGRDAARLISGKDLFWYGARSIDALPRLRQVIAELQGAGAA